MSMADSMLEGHKKCVDLQNFDLKRRKAKDHPEDMCID
jgi:hypothetical protein